MEAMAMKVVMGMVVGERFEEFVRELEETWPDVDFRLAITAEDQKREVADAEVYVGVPTAEMFAAAGTLRWIQQPAKGINWIANVPGLIDSDVVVTNAPGAHATSMADHVIGMMVTFAHHMRDLWDDQRNHVWSTGKYLHGGYEELAGRVCGILALGDIGKAVARRAHGADMKVCAVDIEPMEPPPQVEEVWGLDRLDDLLRLSDWFVVTAPLTPDTRGMIGERELGLMKPTARLINVARAGLVNEEALNQALIEGQIAGIGSDVFADRLPGRESAAFEHKDLVALPHVAGGSEGTIRRRSEVCLENLDRIAQGLEPKHRVR